MCQENQDLSSIDWCKIGQNYIHDHTSCLVFRILEDTTNFFDVDYGNVLLINGVGYLVRGTETEKKFGMEGEPKPWVKSCINLVSGERKIVKLPFHEEFACVIDGVASRCLRNPEKESRILDKTAGHPGFMQGFHCLDSAGNNVRVLDRIVGPSLDNYIRAIAGDHRTYYERHLKGILEGLVYAFQSLADLHRMGEIHGDITPDHIFVDRNTGLFRWIDFDYDYTETNNLFIRDIFEMGMLLSFVVGKGHIRFSEVKLKYPQVAERLRPEQMHASSPNRLADLRLIYPYISEELNSIIMNFSMGSTSRYEDADTLAKDILSASSSLP